MTLKIVGDFGVELVARQYYTTAMMRRRTLRIIAYVLMFIIGTVAVEGFDVLSGGNITEQLFEPIRTCFG